MPIRIALHFLLGCLFSLGLQAQSDRISGKRSLEPFDRVEVHPHIDVILQEGPQPMIHIQAGNRLELHNVITEVKNHTLKVYVKGYQSSDRKRTYPYEQVKVVIYYQQLSRMDIQGDGYLFAGDPLSGRSLELNLHGENQVKLASLQVEEFRASVFGESTLEITSGKAGTQEIRVFGEGKVLAEGLECRNSTLNVFGEATLRVHVTESLKVSTFGDSQIYCTGNPSIDRHRTFGQSSISIVRKD